MSNIRVLLALDPPLLREAVRCHLEREAGIEVVGEVQDPVDLLIAVEQFQADVVLHSWPTSEETPGVCTNLLLEYPDLVAIGLSPDGDVAYISRLEIATNAHPVRGMQHMLGELRQAVDERSLSLIS